MSLRPMRCYHHIKKKPYTRISRRRPRKGYVKGVPSSAIHHFNTGNVKAEFPLTYGLKTSVAAQMRSNSLEAARTIATKFLNTELGDMNFHLKILVFPHHVLRENSMATGAGADRFSEGMRHSFGRPIGTAARLEAGQMVMMASAMNGKDKILKIALEKAAKKLPAACRVVKL